MSKETTISDLLRLMKENFDLVHNRLDAQTAAMSEIRGDIREIRGDIRALNSKVEQNSADIKDLRAELSEFKTEVRREFRDLKFRANQDERERLLLEQRVAELEEQKERKQ